MLGSQLHCPYIAISLISTVLIQGDECTTCCLQLGGVHADADAADMNVSAVALAAVDIAATALDSALLSVERTVERSQQKPEVRSQPPSTHI